MDKIAEDAGWVNGTKKRWWTHPRTCWTVLFKGKPSRLCVCCCAKSTLTRRFNRTKNWHQVPHSTWRQFQSDYRGPFSSLFLWIFVLWASLFSPFLHMNVTMLYKISLMLMLSRYTAPTWYMHLMVKLAGPCWNGFQKHANNEGQKSESLCLWIMWVK